MRQATPWLFEVHGRVSRRNYLCWGVGLMVAKLAIDWTTCTLLFPRPWSPLLYLLAVPSAALHDGVNWQWWLMALFALPFCWVGAALTMRRLRDAACSPWYTVFFVMPIANLVLFALATSLPTSTAVSSGPRSTSSGPLPWFAKGVWPAVIATLATATQVWLAIGPLSTYGGVLFLGLPFLQGFLVGLMARGQGFGGAARLLFISAGLSMTGLLLLGGEGLVCILMAAPIWVPMGLCGVLLGRAAVGGVRRPIVTSLLVLLAAQLAEPLVAPPPSTFEVTTEVVVTAPAQRVWDSLVTFGEIEPPEEAFFRMGIAYPLRATIEGRGPGAVRRCSFNTGDFVEPIKVWDEPRLLSFIVEQCPQPMIEWNPLHEHVDAAHLQGFFAAKRGQFELVPQADGSTLLRGTTWYAHGLGPEPYWSLWSDWLVHAIHRRVLEHIRQRAER